MRAMFWLLLSIVANALALPIVGLTQRCHGRRSDLGKSRALPMISGQDDAANDPYRTASQPSGPVRVTFVYGAGPSDFGTTSPEPHPPWSAVAAQLARRLPNFAGTTTTTTTEGGVAAEVDAIATRTVDSADASSLRRDEFPADVVVALGVIDERAARRLSEALFDGAAATTPPRAFLCDPSCASELLARRRAGAYAGTSLQKAVATLAPWTDAAAGRRLLEKTETLLARTSSEDFLFAVLFCVHALVRDLAVVRSDINPSWEKGPVQNVKEFKTMVDCCGPEIQAALGDPQTKAAIDLLNAVDLRDQVGSYRVIVSNETPQLEEFTLCILQQNNCFNCDAPILARPRVPLLRRWRGAPLDDATARRILVGHLDLPDADADEDDAVVPRGRRKAWSWKIVVGANPAYDAFPMQHQVFYPSGGGRGGSLWYDPVFCVETLDDELVWCKRHYRCTARRHWSATGPDPSPGAWTLTTLDNGMVSEEHWTTVDAADDLSWAVLHYSGAARRAGQSYVGALLCTADGEWPPECAHGPGLERIRDAFRSCDLELWELFGGSTERSFMWAKSFTDWAQRHPPPLERIGDISITAWRKQEREAMLLEQKQQE